MAENYIDKIEVDGVERPIRDTSGSVRYDAAQTLTNEQKAQARGNINAAPGGFGLGELTGRTANSFSDITGYGFYRVPSESGFAPDTSSNWGAIYIGANLSYGTLVYARLGALMAVRSVSGGEVGPIEWINPPMALGVEYRTTERYLGKPVYTKVVACGNLPNGTTAEVAHGIANIGIIVSAQAIASNSTDMFNGLAYLPDIYNGSLTDRWTVYLAGVNYHSIRIFCGGGLAGCPVYVTLKYTKATD